MIDLVTLVTLCSLSVDPKLMHALVWQQSGGEPWSFIVPGEREPRVYRKLRDAVREVRLLNNDGPIRVGLTGLATNAAAATKTTFLPCPNIAAAAHEINQLTARCEANPGSKADPTFCAIAAYHGSWERADTAFARAVRATFSTNDAPNFDMPHRLSSHLPRRIPTATSCASAWTGTMTVRWTNGYRRADTYPPARSRARSEPSP